MHKHRFTLRLPEDLLSRARSKAAAEGRTLRALAEEGLSLVLAKKRPSPRAARLLPRCSAATGGPMPGIDISDSAALQEMDDLEYIERMKNFK